MSLTVMVSTPIPDKKGPLGPRRGILTFEWVKARMDLLTPLTTTVISRWDLGYSVDDARNFSAQAAIDAGCDYLFFLDHDTIPHPQTLHQLVMRGQNELDYDVFSGVYCNRHRDYPAPLVYVGDDFKLSYDWTVGDVLTSEENGVRGFGMGLCLIRTSLLKKLPNSPQKPWFHTTPSQTGNGETEDLWFLKRARAEAGAKLMIDTALLAWHQDIDTGVAYNLPYDSLPVRRWRAANPEIKPSQVPYDCGSVAIMNIGQKVSNCSDLPQGMSDE